MTRIQASSRRSIWRLCVAFVLGCPGPLSGLAFGMPGNGEFAWITWLAGFAALLVAPGHRGFIALIAGAVISAALVDLSDGMFGLVFLVAAVVTALAAHGALSASVLQRARTLGLRLAVRDVRVLSRGGLTIGVVPIFAWFAAEFARNPA
jgi:hypothetical protein